LAKINNTSNAVKQAVPIEAKTFKTLFILVLNNLRSTR